MEKVAADTQISPEDYEKIATYGFSVALASPSVALSPDQVKSAASALGEAVKRAKARQQQIVDTLRGHLKPANA